MRKDFLHDLIVYYSDDEVEDDNEENRTFYESRHFSSKQPPGPSQPRKTAKINISESKQSQSQTKVQTLSAPKLSKTKKTTFVATTKMHPDAQQLQPKHAQRNISRCCECHGAGGKSKCVQNCPCKRMVFNVSLVFQRNKEIAEIVKNLPVIN